MQFDELKSEIKNIVYKDVRADSEDYFEAVIASEELKNLGVKLEQLFGLPYLPWQYIYSDQVHNAIKGFGGIMAGQTLYFWNKDNDVAFTMLWPWRDGKHTTVKIGYRSNKGGIVNAI